MSNMLPTHVWNLIGTERGEIMGYGIYPCADKDCPGDRIAVRWPDGKITWPCTEGLKDYDGIEDGDWQIA